MKSNVGHPLSEELDPKQWVGRYFRLWEAMRSNLAARLGIDNRPNPTQLQNIRWMAHNLLDPIREQFGPLRVNSWLRVPDLNERIPGSSSTSAHVLGYAVDFVPIKPEVSLRDIMVWVSESDLPADQCILEYNSWVHIGGREGRPRSQLLMKFHGSGYIPFDPTDSRITG